LVFSAAKNPILSIAMNLDVPARPTIVAIGLIHAIQLFELMWMKREPIARVPGWSSEFLWVSRCRKEPMARMIY
jgi:hypothetical protein